MPKAPVSRLKRWETGVAAGDRSNASRSKPNFVRRISQNHEAAAVCEGRANAAATIATAQARKATERLEAARLRTKTIAVAAAAAGALGLIGNLIAILVTMPVEGVRIGIAILSTLAMGVPLILCLANALQIGDGREVEAAVAAEGAARLSGFAKRIGDAVAQAADGTGLSPTALVILNPLLDAAEQEAETAKTREQIIYAYSETLDRPDQRIKPKKDRVIVTAPDGRKLTARILDLSMAGVALETEMTGIGIGSTLVIGSRKAMAVRKLSKGMAYQFQKPLPASAFDADIIL